MDNAIENYIKEYGLDKIVALPEYCEVFVNDNKMQIIGEYPAYIFDRQGKKKVENKEYFE